ncbi:MAG: ribonuclease Z [Candidatus Pacearchaeota archaeon]|jgi:ribonuclease Z
MTEKIKITFLGTSDAIPTAERNHTSIWLNFAGENILIDCGEGTQRQIRKAGLNPCKLTRILITHWHADHILGLPGLLKTMAMSGYNKTLHIYGPKGTKFLMAALSKLFAIHDGFKIEIKEISGKFFETKDFYLSAEKMAHGVSCNAYSFVKKGQIRIDKSKLKKLKIKEGVHLKDLKKGKSIKYNGKTYKAKNLTYKEGEKKITFVFDTKINDKIVPFAKNSDIFVCEASSVNEDTAKKHQHMMAEQAAEIAKRAKVKKLILSHISQRVERDINGNLSRAKKKFSNTFVAKDLYSVEI